MTGQSKKILVVEDEESNYALLFAILNKRGYAVDWAQSGVEAVEKCKQNEFDLILMDIKMPKMNGYEAIAELRKMNITTPVIAQTAYARVEDEEKVLQHGFNEYISKPIRHVKLNELLEKYL